MSIDIAGTPGVFAETPDLFQARVVARDLAAIEEVDSVVVHVASAGEPNVVRCGGPIEVLLAALIDLPEVSISETRGRYLLRHRIRWRSGDPSPGVSVLYRVARNPQLSAEEFHSHWEHNHGPLAVARHMGMWDYEQLSVVDSQQSGLDGVAVVQFPCLEDYKKRFFDGPEGRALITADAAHFTDSPNVARQLTTEQVMKAPALPASGRIRVSDHRQLELSADPEEVWALLGDFSRLLDWWPGGLASAEVTQGEPPTREVTRDDGTSVTESLVRHDDQERMFQLAITRGLPPGIAEYTCRYEVRSVPNGCRLDWDPRATVEPDSAVLLAGIVDEGWRRVTVGLASKFTVTPPSMGGVNVAVPPEAS